MPVVLESKSNTNLLLRVQENVLQARPVTVLDFPPETPPAFGLMQSDRNGKLTWLTQYVNALVPPPNLLFYAKNQFGTNGEVQLPTDSTMTLDPYSAKVVYALVFKIRTYNSSGCSAVYGQGSIVFDPLQPLDQIWQASAIDQFGDQANSVTLAMALQRTVGNGVIVSLSSRGTPGDFVEVDAVVYSPSGVPLA